MARLAINRYLKIIIKRASLEIMNLAEYRSSFFMGALGTFAYTFIEIMFIYVMVAQFDTIGGWNKYEILIGFVTMQFVFYLYFIFLQGHDAIPEQVRTGKLDMFLTKPLNSYFSLNFQRINIAETLAGLILEIGIFIYCFHQLNLNFSYEFIFYLLGVILGTLILNTVLTLIHFLSFWMVDPDVLFGRLFYEICEDFSRYPITIFKDPLRTMFMTVFPMGLVAYVPSYFLVRGFDIRLLLLQISVFCVFFIVSVFIYKRGLKSYTGASA